MMATCGHHDGNPLPSRWQPIAIRMLTRRQARRHTGSQAHRLTGSQAHGRGGVRCGRVPFWHSLAKPKPERRVVFSTASLCARFHRKLARREAFQKVSLRACRARERLLAHVTSRNLRKMATRGGPERQFAHVTSRNLRELAHSATIARREAGEKVSLRTRFHQKLARREAFRKFSP